MAATPALMEEFAHRNCKLCSWWKPLGARTAMLWTASGRLSWPQLRARGVLARWSNARTGIVRAQRLNHN